MQTLVFNTTTKTVKLYSGKAESSEIQYNFNEVPTVKISEFYYEVLQEEDTELGKKRYPVARFPISNTNMLILK